ncbi:MAG: hypothetical protein PHH83_02505 [Patescibacteria group bacterium]|nr:hypothetical protein [Patescibacteria group bacterium]
MKSPEEQGQNNEASVQENPNAETRLSFKFSFRKPDDLNKKLNDAIVVFAKEHHLSASQSTCCGASKGKNR